MTGRVAKEPGATIFLSGIMLVNMQQILHFEFIFWCHYGIFLCQYYAVVSTVNLSTLGSKPKIKIIGYYKKSISTCKM